MWLILEEPSGGSWWIPVVEIDRSQRRILVDPHAESKWIHVVDPGLINEVDPGGSAKWKVDDVVDPHGGFWWIQVVDPGISQLWILVDPSGFH